MIGAMATALDVSTSAVVSLIQMIAEKAPSTTLAALIADPMFGGLARGIRLGDLLGVRTSKSAGATSSARNGASEAKRSTAAATPAKNGRPAKSADVRTDEGRAQYDAAVLGVIAGGTGPWSAVAVRAKAGGTETQFRAAVERLLAKKKVKRNGKARGTRYTAA